MKRKESFDEKIKLNKERWDSNVRNIRERFEDWMNNIAYYLGYQYQTYDSAMYSYQYPPFLNEDSTIMAQCNLIKPLADARIAQYVGNRPVLQVISQDKGAESIQQAEKESNIINALWQNYNVSSLLVDVAKWMVVCNQPFVRWFWDANAGDAVENPAYVDNMLTPNEPSTFNVGELGCELITGFNIIFSPFCRTFDDVRKYGWISLKCVKTRGELKRLFPDKSNVIDKFDNESVSSVTDPEEQTLRKEDSGSYEMRINSSYGDKDNHTMTVYENYDASNKSHVIICQEELLLDSTYKTKKIPIIMFQDQPTMLGSVGKSLVSQSRQVQKIFNTEWSRILEYSMLPIIYAIPKDSLLRGDDLLDRAYIIVGVEEGEPLPQIVKPGTPDELWFFVLNQCQQQLEHLWGMHEVSIRGQTPSNSRLSGRGIFLLQGKDEQRHAPAMIYWEDSLRDMGELMLELVHLNSKDERSMYFIGENGQKNAVKFTGSDITGQNKISVEVSSDYAENKQALQQFVKDILQVSPNLPALQKYLNDPVVIYKLMSFINDKLANVLMHDNKDASTAQRENRKFMDVGIISKVEMWHNHEEHVIQHLAMMNSPEYDNLQQERKQMWEQGHFMIHWQTIQSAAQQQMMMAQMSKGGQQQQGMPPMGMFQESPQVNNPLYAIDQAVEQQINPSGQLGMEEVP